MGTLGLKKRLHTRGSAATASEETSIAHCSGHTADLHPQSSGGDDQ